MTQLEWQHKDTIEQRNKSYPFDTSDRSHALRETSSPTHPDDLPLLKKTTTLDNESTEGDFITSREGEHTVPIWIPCSTKPGDKRDFKSWEGSGSRT